MVPVHYLLFVARSATRPRVFWRRQAQIPLKFVVYCMADLEILLLCGALISK